MTTLRDGFLVGLAAGWCLLLCLGFSMAVYELALTAGNLIAGSLG